ncbi:MAG: hypothetical protein KGJ01_02210 [Patescibacteria group bacterium]|nr:hypothetical protein [Patescibacteria group bacterium]
MAGKKKLLLIDANSLIHRAYHALPPLTSKGGKPAGALYGLSSMLLKIIKERRPEYIAAAFDRPEPTKREEEYAEYKATRPPAEESLVSQLIESRELFKKFGIVSFERPGYEADDLVASLAEKFKNDGLDIVIFSGDQDLFQMVEDGKIVVETPLKGIRNSVVYDGVGVKEKFGVPPDKVADYKGLVGDVSDNIPGVPGVGPKTAAGLIEKYGSVENLVKEFREIGLSEAKVADKLKGKEEQALMSKRIAVILKDVPLDTDLESLRLKLDKNALGKYFEELGFSSLSSRLQTLDIES